MANWIQRFLAAIATHKADASAHHTKFDIFDKFRECISWNSLDAYSPGGDAGYDVIAMGSCVRIRTGAVVDDVARIKSGYQWYRIFETGKVVTIEIPIDYIWDVSATYFWLRFDASPTVETEPPSETSDHIGWKMINGDLYASNGDGATQKITDTLVNLSAVSQWTRLRMVFNPGVDCKFYVNDVLKVTHTENLPDLLNYYLYFVVQTKQAATTYIRARRVLIEKEYA